MEQSTPTLLMISLDGLSGERDAITLPDPRSILELRAGDPCPDCQEACLDYDGLLNLSCPRCGYTVTGGFT